MRYIQVSKALYDYEAQTEEELSIREDNTLYVIEKEDDDWWKAELKQPNSTEQGPVGLVPATYLEPITPIGRVRAEYDYQAQQEEELSFNEDDEMDLLETDDPDWYLVQSNNGDIGLVPSNYVQTIDQQEERQEEQAAVPETSIYTPPPPPPSAPQVPMTAPPTIAPVLTQRSASTSVNDEAQSWNVNEYDTIKKKKKKDRGSLFVGNGMLCYGSETDKSLPVQQYPILDVTKYLYDGKVLHIEIDGVKAAVLDLQASSKSEAKAILAKISDSSRAAQMSNVHVNPYERQIAAPASAIVPRSESPEAITIHEPEPTCEPKWGISLFSFQAEGGDELSVSEQEQLYVVDYERTDGWYRVQKTNGDTGLVPSTYIQFDDDDARKREEEEQKRKEEQQKRREEEERRRRREEEERRRREEEERRRREEEERRRKEEEEARQKQIEERKAAERKAQQQQQQLARSNSRKDLPKPDQSKVRTWTDRSGSFKVEAQFIDFHNGKLRLHKLNGVKIDVPIEKMSPEDVRWVEKYGQAAPQKKFNERWDWFDWFMIIGIPMQASLQYASAFKADKLDDSDIPKLTHRQMKTLGLTEDHVQRVERYIETGVPEYYEDEENKKKQQLQDQIRKDEEYAKKLQKEMEQSKSISPTTNGRPRPSTSTPKKEIHPDLLDFIGNQLTSDTAKVKEAAKPNNDFIGFNDDAWAPRSTSSPVTPVAAPPPPPPGPTPEQLKEQEAERKRKEEQDQIRKIQLMGLEKQTRDQKQQLEELQKLTQQQIEIQKQIAMQTGTQQQQQVLQLQAQKQQLEQQQQIAQVTGFNPQPTGFNAQPTGFTSQLTGFISQTTGFTSQPTGFTSQPTGFTTQTSGFSSQGNNTTLPGSNGRPRPTPSNNIISNPSLSQWQPQQQQQQLSSPPQQNGFQPNSFAQPQQQQQQAAWQGLQPQMTGFPTTQYQQAPVLQPSLAPTTNSIGIQPTGRNWNSATPANPFGSPSISPLQAQMTGVQFSTPSPQAFNQPLQAQMTGFPPPQGNNVFTPQGSMQYGQSAFPAQRPW